MASTQEETILRQFCKVVDDLHECRFVKTIKVQDHTITINSDPSKNRLPHYDRDDFRSFATLFRKLVANKEPTQLYRVMNIIKRHTSKEHHESFKRVKKDLHQLATAPPIAIAIGTSNSETPYTPQRICDVLFNGLVFHTDNALQADVDRLLEFEPFAIPAFLQYACAVVDIATQYASLIEHHNYYADLLGTPSDKKETQ